MCREDVIKMLPRMSLGILFLTGGLMKLFVFTPEGFSGMIAANFASVGLVGAAAVVAAWLVTIAEITGGLALILGKIIPKVIYQNLIRVLMLITLAAIIFVDTGSMNGGADIMAILKNIVIIATLIMVCNTKTTCPFGITGNKTRQKK